MYERAADERPVEPPVLRVTVCDRLWLQVMREWAANRTAAGVPTHFIDFDTWSNAPNVPAACAKNNKHYACHLRGLGPKGRRRRKRARHSQRAAAQPQP